MRISDWSSDVCSSDLAMNGQRHPRTFRQHVGDLRVPTTGDNAKAQRSRCAQLAFEMGHETLTTKCTACSLAVVRSLRGLWSGAVGLPEIDELDHHQPEPGQHHLPPWRTDPAQTGQAQGSKDLRPPTVGPTGPRTGRHA